MQEFTFTPFPILTTERLVLRQLEFSDNKAIFELRSDKRITEFIDRPLYRRLDEADYFIRWIFQQMERNRLVYWGISYKDHSDLLGTICLWNIREEQSTAEVGYELLKDYQQKGIMNEALEKVLEYAFKTLQFRAIDAFTHKDNEASKRLLVKNGFKHESHRKDPKVAVNIVFRKVA